MKLADMQGLSDNFLNEMYGDKAYQEDEPEMPEMDDEDAMMGDEMADDDMADDEMAGDEGPDEAPEPEMPELDDEDDEMGEEADEVEITEDDRDILAKAADILSKIAGGGGADAGMDDMDMDMEDEAGMRDAMFEGDDELGEGMDDGDMIDEVQIVDENKLVQEVTRRVAERLRKAIKSRK
jgi:hypothetical protein